MKIQGGVDKIFAKISVGQGFQNKITEGYPTLGCTAFLLTIFLKIFIGGAVSPPPVCIYELEWGKGLKKGIVVIATANQK
jgi:hypothetical protein